MKNILSIALLSFLSVSLFAGNRKLNTYVNPMIGASTDVEIAGAYHGLGKTFPGAATPYGMVQVSPQTITGGDNGSGYSDHMKTIEGFCLTQMSGTSETSPSCLPMDLYSWLWGVRMARRKAIAHRITRKRRQHVQDTML